MKWIKVYIVLFFISLCLKSIAQISPGDLSIAHQELEGIMNCTKCHELGEAVSNDKCLECHVELKALIDQNRGYHASSELKVQECISCHSEHNGRNFKLVRFDEKNFSHKLTGFELSGAHNKIDCRECHKPDLIANVDLKKNENTFLGLERECLSCHDDVHHGTLSGNCLSCHDMEAFSPAKKFNHDQTSFSLKGKHRSVDCIECHQVETLNGENYQHFTGIKFDNCTACHEDVHNNKFGSNCSQCHNEQSFTQTVSSSVFDHNMTGFGIEGKHMSLDCKECHKTNLTDPLPHSSCLSCHKDYHDGQFTSNGVSQDCSECHSVNGFEMSSYTIEEHNKTKFQLENAHLATPCFECHKVEERWNFKISGDRCINCHDDIHNGLLSEKYYPDQRCENCHATTSWMDNSFNHDLTGFKLVDTHAQEGCLDCHKDNNGASQNNYVNFTLASSECLSCHIDNHNGQFEENGQTDCEQCHGFKNWEIQNFDHTQTAFTLEGKHASVTCSACHKEVSTGGKSFVQYKITSFQCADCHI